MADYPTTLIFHDEHTECPNCGRVYALPDEDDLSDIITELAKDGYCCDLCRDDCNRDETEEEWEERKKKEWADNLRRAEIGGAHDPRNDRED